MTPAFKERQIPSSPSSETIQSLDFILEELIAKKPEGFLPVNVLDYPKLFKQPLFGVTAEAIVLAGRGAVYLKSENNTNLVISIFLKLNEHEVEEEGHGFLQITEADKDFNGIERSYAIYADGVIRNIRYIRADEMDETITEDLLVSEDIIEEFDDLEEENEIYKMSDTEVKDLINEVKMLIE